MTADATAKKKSKGEILQAIISGRSLNEDERTAVAYETAFFKVPFSAYVYRGQKDIPAKNIFVFGGKQLSVALSGITFKLSKQ